VYIFIISVLQLALLAVVLHFYVHLIRS